MVRDRVCKLCGQAFEFVVSRQGGHPREYCYSCVPEGWKLVKLPHRVKLRRVKPSFTRPAKGGLVYLRAVD